MLTLLLQLALAVPANDCEKVKLIDQHTNEVTYVCYDVWVKEVSKYYETVCIDTPHGHGHLYLVLKADHKKVVLPMLEGKALVCEKV